MRLQILGSAGIKYVGFAKKKFASLQATRLDHKLPALKRIYNIGQVTITVFSSDWSNLIRISGGGLLPHILLHNGTELHSYNYYQDKTKNPLDYEGAGSLQGAFDGRSQINDVHQATFSKKWSQGAVELPTGGDFLVNINSFELSAFNKDGTIYGRVGEDAGPLASITDEILNLGAVSYGGLIGIPSFNGDQAWNIYRGAVLYAIAPQNKAVTDSWYWTPSFFFVAPADEYQLFSGVYYGQYPSSDYGFTQNDFGGFYEPLTSATVTLKGLLDQRHSGGLYQYGWCEHVTEINGEAVNDLNFYLQEGALAPVTNDTFSNYTYSGITSNATITVGNEIKGFAKTLQLHPDISNYEVDMWNFDAYNADSGGVGIILYNSSEAVVYRYSEYNAEVYRTSSYHSHSRSNDGTILAIFEGSGGLITNVVVFDLYGTREGLADGEEYTSGGVTEIQNSSDVASVEAVTGCIISYREEDFEPLALTYDLATSTPTAQPAIDILTRPSLSIVQFNKIAASGGVIQKVVCEDGVTAKFSISTDECADNTYVLDAIGNNEKLVGTVDVGGGVSFAVRGDFAGSGEDITFTGVGSGTVIKRPDEFILQASESTGEVYPEPYSYIGDFIAGACMKENPSGSGYVVDTDACPCGDVTLTASTTCGQTASREYSGSAPSAVTVGVSDTADVVQGDFVTASGGATPYQFYGTGALTVDVNTGEITSISDCSALDDPRWETVSVTDACGQTDEMIVRLPNGYWKTTSSTTPSSSSCWYATRVVSDGTRTTNYYGDNGREATDEFYSYNGSCIFLNPYSDTGSGYVINSSIICTETPTTPDATTDQDYYTEDATCSTSDTIDGLWRDDSDGNQRRYGWRKYGGSPIAQRIEEWVCQEPV